jgi:hypothetical protein
VIETTISGFIVEGKTGSSTFIDFHEVLGNLAMRVVYNGANFQFEGFVNSEEIRFQSRNSSAAVRELLFMDPDDDIEIYHPATDRIAFRTTALGAAVRGPAVDSVTLTLEDSAATDMLTVAGSSTLVTFVSEKDGSAIRFRGSDAGASIRTLWDADPDGEFNAYRVGALRAGTRFDGWRILGLLNNAPSAGGTQDVSLNFETNVGTIAGAVRYTTGTTMRIENFVHGGNIELFSEDGAGALQFLFQGDPDGSATLYAAGTAHLIAATGSMTFKGGSTTGYSGLIQGTGGLSLSTLSISAATWIYSSTVDSVTMALRATNSSSVATTLFLGDPDTDTRLFHQNIATVITLASAAGGLSALNTLTGGGVERVLTQSDDAVTATTAELTAIADAINTAARKVAGFEVFNTTTSIVVWAVGAADGSVWVDATGATAHTPA